MGYQLIDTIEVGSGGATHLEFTSIPQDGVDLQVVLSGRSTDGSNYFGLQFNSDTGSNYNYIIFSGTGTAALSATITSGSFLRIYSGDSDYTANTFGNSSAYIPNYTSNSAKSYSTDAVNENNSTAGIQNLGAGSWTGTSAITSLKIYGAIAQYSTASLYKITAD